MAFVWKGRMRTVGSHRAKRGLGVAKRSRHPAGPAKKKHLHNKNSYVNIKLYKVIHSKTERDFKVLKVDDYFICPTKKWILGVFFTINLFTAGIINQNTYADATYFLNSSSTYYNSLKQTIENDPNRNTADAFDVDIDYVRANLGIGFNFGNSLDYSYNNEKHRRYSIRFSVGYDATEYYYYETNFNQAGNIFELDNRPDVTQPYANLAFASTSSAPSSSSSPINYFKISISNPTAAAQNRQTAANISYLTIKGANGDDILNDSSLLKEYSFTLGSSATTILNYSLNTTVADFMGSQTALHADVQLGNFVSDYKNSPTAIYTHSYNGPVATDEELAFLKEQGFSMIRLPITWYNHMDSTGTIDPEWFVEVNQVVNRILSYGFYVIVDIHHDTGRAGWIKADSTLFSKYETTYRYLVLQIAENFKNYGSHLILESPNETTTYNNDYTSNITQDNHNTQNSLTQIFVDEVRRTGYNNTNRILLLNVIGGFRRNIVSFVLPTDTADDKLMVGFHDYTIRDDGTLASLEYFNDTGAQYLSQYKLLMGEFGIQRTETLSKRLQLMDRSVAYGYQTGIPMILWDDGGSYALMKKDAAAWDANYNSDQVAEAMLNAYKQNKTDPDKNNISLSIDTDNLMLNVISGVFASKNMTITASTTNYTGYSIFIENPGESNALINTTDNQYTIPAISLPEGKNSISSNEFNVGYGYSTNNTDYKPLPDGHSKATLFSSSTASASEDVIDFSCGVKTDHDIKPGLYQRTYIISAVVNPLPYIVTYNANTTDTVNNMPTTQTGSSTNGRITLASETPTREGYTFLGWTEDQNSYTANYQPEGILELGASSGDITLYAIWAIPCAPNKICYDDNGASSTITMDNQSVSSNSSVTLWAPNFKRTDYYGFAGWNTASNGTGTYYGPNETITVGDLSKNGLRLYAIWVASAGNLQDWDGCPALNIGEVVGLTDSRDQNTYAVARLADGNCWMTENLRLSNTAVINSTNTNNPASGFTLSASSSSWCNNDTDECINQSSLNTVNTANPVSTMTTESNSNIYAYGNYYNWYSATAGNGVRSTNGTISGDICPSGWRLPFTSDTLSGGYGYLANKMESGTLANSWRKYPYNYIYSGGISSSSFSSRGNQGFYATSTSTGTNTINRLYLTNSNTQTNYTGTTGKSTGRSVRCATNPSAKYTVKFNANGGNGTMSNQVITADLPTALNINTFSRHLHYFVSWNTKADGTGTSYGDGESVTNLVNANEIIELYAQWQIRPHINYHANAPDVVGEMPIEIVRDNNSEYLHNGSNYSLSASNFSRSGYGFAGWNTESDYSGTFYGPMETYTVSNVETDPIIDFYAVWVQSAGSLQDANTTSSVCESLTAAGVSNNTLDSVSALTDQRDNQTYAIAKLADGKCWMIENLRLDSTATIGSTNQALSQGYGGSFIGLANSETPWGDLPTQANSLYNLNDPYITPRYNNINTSSRQTRTNYSKANNIYGYGNYYNWPAAIADTTAHSGNNQSVTTTSICPTGWRLPLGGDTQSLTNNDFWQLGLAVMGAAPINGSRYEDIQTNSVNQTASQAFISFPNNFILSGHIQNDTSRPIGRTGVGVYITSTTIEDQPYVYGTTIDAFMITNSSTGLAAAAKYRGGSIRCVADTVNP